jgi:ribosome-binding ATPase YchF (GTP1/OBG family)
MQIGICGKPNSGKSTFFCAATMMDALIANYPFTTIEPNKGIGFVRAKCPHTEHGKVCTPKIGSCMNGTRLIPISLIDVAGLVPGAHEGRGLGNKFLDDLREADAFIQIVDCSGHTDLEGNPATAADPAEEVKFLYDELCWWLESILERNWAKIQGKGIDELATVLTGLKVSKAEISHVADSLMLPTEGISWDATGRLLFAKEIFKKKPFVIAANKMDSPAARANFAKLKAATAPKNTIPCSAAIELALRRAAKANVISYVPGDASFEILGGDEKQKAALETMKSFISSNNGSGVQQALETAIYDSLGMVAAYPVEDEHHWADNFGHVLPHAFLMPKGSTALDLAAKVHTDLAAKFIGAIDCRTHMRHGKEYVLRHGDVIKIVAGR